MPEGGKRCSWRDLLWLCGGGGGGGGRASRKDKKGRRYRNDDVEAESATTAAAAASLPFPSVAFRSRQYRLVRLLGSGAYGEVYLARHPASGESVAVKRHIRASGDFKDFALSQRLAAVMAGRPAHPLVVRLLGHVTQGSERLTVMEFCPGGDLQRLLPRLRPSADEAEVAYFVLEVAEAIGFLHEAGVFHLDVRPCNVFLSRQLHCRLADFSICEVRAAGAGGPRGGGGGGSAAFNVWLSCRGHWLPPEIRPDRPSPAGCFTDWYSLGALAAAVAAGSGEAPGRLSAGLRHFVSRLLQRDPRDRLGSQGGLTEVLSHGFITGQAQLRQLPPGAGVAGVREFVRRQRLRPPDRVRRVLQQPD